MQVGIKGRSSKTKTKNEAKTKLKAREPGKRGQTRIYSVWRSGLGSRDRLLVNEYFVPVRDFVYLDSFFRCLRCRRAVQYELEDIYDCQCQRR